jgi:hypothetical protein
VVGAGAAAGARRRRRGPRVGLKEARVTLTQLLVFVLVVIAFVVLLTRLL